MDDRPLDEKLREKGWSEADIQKTVSIVQKGQEKKYTSTRIIDKIVYWSALFVAIIGNMVISITLVPFLISFEGAYLYMVIAVLGFCFGIFFDLLIRDIEKLQTRHYVIAGLFIPAIAFINMMYMTNFANQLIERLKVNTAPHNPYYTVTFYTASFIIPYLVNKFIRKL